MIKQSKLLSVVLAVAVALLILSSSIAVPILCRPFYYAHIDAMGLEEYIGLDEIYIRQAYDEMMDLTKELEENENGLFLNDQLKYFGTLTDRADRLMSRTSHLLEYARQVKEAYQSQIDNRQNNNMQFLTVISTIFFPLTLITGWFGMNFKDMPGLENGYPAVMALSIVIIVICILIFKKKKII